MLTHFGVWVVKKVIKLFLAFQTPKNAQWCPKSISFFTTCYSEMPRLAFHCVGNILVNKQIWYKKIIY